MKQLTPHQLPVDVLRTLLAYDPDTGAITWRLKRGCMRPGELAGSIDQYGYLKIGIRKTTQLGHRVAWALFYGEWPDSYLDHINRQRADNRIANLRLATTWESARNRCMPERGNRLPRGVVQQHDKWRATIGINKQSIYLGMFPSQEAAAAAYNNAAKKYHGDFAVLNNVETSHDQHR